MDSLKQHLSLLGISDEESQVYVNALETGASTVLEYAQNTGIPRTTVYLLVESLIEKKLLTETMEGKRKKYIPASPADLISLAKEKEYQYKMTAQAIEKEKEVLDALYNQKEGKPHIEYKEGVLAMREIFSDSLKADSLYMHFTSEIGREVWGDEGEWYYEQYMKRMIPTKQIIRKSIKNVNYKKEEETTRNQIVLIEEEYAADTDFLIYKDNVVYISYNKNIPQVVVLKDVHIAYFEKMRFNLLFKSLQ